MTTTTQITRHVLPGLRPEPLAAAALGPRLQCAVPGRFGTRQAGPINLGLCVPSLMATASRTVSAPVLYHVQWDDAIFPATGSSSYSARWPSADKQLLARPGPHAQTHPGDETTWQDFIRLNTPGTCTLTPPSPGTTR